MSLLLNIHPGEILQEEYLTPLKLTAYRLAKDTGVPQTRISAILKGQRSVSADTALRLGRFFNTSAQFWLNLQNAYDLRKAAHDAGQAIKDLMKNKAFACLSRSQRI
jgi:addiction module HigA family antidote